MMVKMVINKIQKQCEVCNELFTPKTVTSVYCSRHCSDVAYRKRKVQKKKEDQKRAVIESIPDDRPYISVPEAVALLGIAKSTLYRLVRQGRIPAINLGTRLVRIDRVTVEQMFPDQPKTLPTKENPAVKLYRLEREDCYTIGEIAKRFGISDSSVYKHIRKFSIPIRQIGKFVYAPKTEIDSIYNSR